MYKKLLTISLLIIILISIFSVNCYASNDAVFEFTFKDKGIDLPDIYISNLPDLDFKYLTLINHGIDYSGKNLFFVLSPNLPYFSSYDSSKGKYTLSCSGTLIAQYILREGESSWSFNTWLPNPYTSFNYSPSAFLYSNYDIKYSDKVIIEAYSTLTPFVKSMRSVKMLDSVLNETISILPITLTVVVGLVAIRKGIFFITKKIRNS